MQQMFTEFNCGVFKLIEDWLPSATVN